MSSEFAEDLKKSFFPSLLKWKFGEYIRKDIRGFRENIVGLKENPNYHKALELILEIVMTNSWWRPLPDDMHKEYEKQFSLFHNRFGDEDFKTRVTKSVKGTRALIEAGFDFVLEMDGFKIFRKRK